VQSRQATDAQRRELIASLALMSAFLRDAFGAITAEEARSEGSPRAFCPVEQVWHLADLECYGFGARIRQLREEANPHLPDFDGARVAKERNYRARSLVEGLSAFEAARAANLATLTALGADEWARGGTQEGVGVVSLGGMPALMRRHDEAHMAEIRDWQKRFDRRTDGA
jgi:hypothetical protein